MAADHWIKGGQSLGHHDAAGHGSSAPGSHVAQGTDCFSLSSHVCVNSDMEENVFVMAGGNLFHPGNSGNSFSSNVVGLAKPNELKEVMARQGGEKNNGDDQHTVGIASSQATGTFSTPITNEIHSSSTCNLTECSPDNMPVNHTVEEVIAFGGIAKPSSGVRSSTRLGNQVDGDMPQMDKAMKMGQSRDDTLVAGKPSVPKFSIVNIPDSEVMHRAESLGVSLGKNEMEVLRSIRGIKTVEEKRILTFLHKNVDENVGMNEGPSTLVISKVSNLCEDLVDDESFPLELDDQLEHLKQDIKRKKTRQRKTYDSSNIRRSTRRRIKKQFS
jgi:hypothetical protein